MSQLNLSETLNSLMRRAEAGTKTASEAPAPSIVPVTDKGAGLRKVAEALRAYRAPEPTLATFHVVKQAMIDGSFGPLARPEYQPKSANPEAEGLRKVAHVLREEEINGHEVAMLKAACAITAARAITLLKEYR